jgi:transposase
MFPKIKSIIFVMKRSNLFPILGIDIAKAKFDACLVLDSGHVHRHTFTNDPQGFEGLLQWVKAHGVSQVHAALEATGPYWVALAHFLYEQQWAVYLLNPAYVKAHAQSRGSRTKTDRTDAQLIADYLVSHDCEPWQPLPAELEALRELTRLYADVTALAVSASQRAEGLRTELARQLQAKVTQALKEFSKEILAAARQHVRQHPSLEQSFEQLDSIAGVAQVTALVLLAELPRGRPARSVAGWAGVTPRQCESGTSIHLRPKMCKQGSDYLRQALYWPAITALRCCPAMKAFGDRLQAAGLTKMQIIGAAMHKLLRWSVGVINSDKMFDPSFHVTT